MASLTEPALPARIEAGPPSLKRAVIGFLGSTFLTASLMVLLSSVSG